jgi:hypothetical protein
MRLPGAPRIADDSLDPWQRDDGPQVLSGVYHVRLAVDGRTFVQSFEIVPDPRLTVTAEELRSQFDLLCLVLEQISRANRLINQLGTLQAQVQTWRSWTAEHPGRDSIREAAQPLEESLSALKERMIDIHYPEAQLHAIGIQEKLNALFEFVDSANYPPPRQAQEVFDQLTTRLQAVVDEFDREVPPLVAGLNGAMAEAGVALISG